MWPFSQWNSQHDFHKNWYDSNFLLYKNMKIQLSKQSLKKSKVERYFYKILFKILQKSYTNKEM